MALTGAVYREKRYVCGEYMDVYIYPVYPCRAYKAAGRKRKHKPTREVQKRLNRRHAEEKAARLLNTNFTEDDLSLTLTYAEPVEVEDAKKDMQKFLRKLRGIYSKAKTCLRYMWTMEVGSKSGRAHFHMVLSGGIDRDRLEKLWGKGYANTRRLQFNRSGLSALAKYITKQHRAKVNKEEDEVTQYRCYNCSKNLVDPEPEISDSRIRSRRKAKEMAELDMKAWAEMYPEYEMADVGRFFEDDYGSIYMFARMHRMDCVRIEPKKKTQRKQTRRCRSGCQVGV